MIGVWGEAPCLFFLGSCAEFKAQNTCEQSLPHVSTFEPMNGSSAKPKVLVADDEQVIANSLAAILNMSGFEASAVYSGQAAVDALSSFEPDILVSDVIMPGMTGVEAAIAILAQCPNCKVLLFSGQAATVDLLNQAQAQGYWFEILAEPVHPVDLLGKVRALAC
jgi:CheY-like chemotaxis protein